MKLLWTSYSEAHLVHEALGQRLRADVERVNDLLCGKLIVSHAVGAAEERAIRPQLQLVLKQPRQRLPEPVAAGVLVVLAR